MYMLQMKFKVSPLERNLGIAPSWQTIFTDHDMTEREAHDLKRDMQNQDRNLNMNDAIYRIVYISPRTFEPVMPEPYKATHREAEYMADNDIQDCIDYFDDDNKYLEYEQFLTNLESGVYDYE